MLQLIKEKIDISEMLEGSVKISTIHQSLIRKGLITDLGDELTLIGKELLEFIDTPMINKFVKRKPDANDFDNWWKAFPGTDSFTYKDKTFAGSRTLRQNKEGCKLKFDKILLEGEYTAQEMIDALEYDILQKKENSIKQKANKLTFMQNSLTYLNQRSFEPFIELIKQGKQINEAQDTGGTDI
jgi:hypothetical protein